MTTFKFTQGTDPNFSELTVGPVKFSLARGYIPFDQIDKQKESLEKMLNGENSKLYFTLYTDTEIEFELIEGVFNVSYEVVENPFWEVNFSVDFESNKEDIKQLLKYIVSDYGKADSTGEDD